MDEPFANIDIENSVIIISSHELHDMDTLLDEIILINEGQYITSESVETIKASKSESQADWYIESIK